MRNPLGARAWALGLLLPGLVALAPVRQEAHCVEAERFLVDTLGMAAVTDPDTIDDWRTHQRVPGCRVTAAGITKGTAAEATGAFYDAVRAAGWTRTPEARDAPNEGSLRFRRNGSDCLFNVYTGGLLGTEAEFTVDARRVPLAGELRYNVLAMCMEAMDAAR